MKKKLILTLLCLSSVACAQSNENEIKQTYTDHNRTDGYFIKKVQLDDQKVVQELITKNWYFSEQLVHKSNPSKEINNCQSLSNALIAGYKARNYQEESMISAMNRMCNVWSMMGQLSQSKTSYLVNFTHSQGFTPQAPPELALIISKDDERRLAKAKSWQEMSKIQKVEKVNPDQAIYYDNSGGIQRLTLMAKGDYNQDGIEDAVLYMENSVEGGSYSSTHAYIITRLAENAPYTLLKQL